MPLPPLPPLPPTLTTQEEMAEAMRAREKELEAQEKEALMARKSSEDMAVLARFGIEGHSAAQLRSVLVDYARRVDPKGKELKRLVDGEPYGGGSGGSSDRDCDCDCSSAEGGNVEWADDWHDEYDGGYGHDEYGHDWHDEYGGYGDDNGGEGAYGDGGEGNFDGEYDKARDEDADGDGDGGEGSNAPPNGQTQAEAEEVAVGVGMDGTAEVVAGAEDGGESGSKAAEAAGKVLCPDEFPYLRVTDGSDGWDICYKEQSFATTGSGPCDTWCAPGESWHKVKDLWGECGQECRYPGSEDAGREGTTDGDVVPPLVEEEEEEDLLAPPSGGGGGEVSTPIKRLRAEIRTADRHEREVAREVEELEEEAQANLGPDGEYQPLWGKCFTLPHAQYTYEMCVGGEAQQKEGAGRGTGLGEWDGIEDEGEPDSSRGLPGKAFVFRHGDHCWNGPARSLRVTLFCSVEEKLSEVDEPTTCEYVMKFGTPAACDLGHQEGLVLDMEESPVG